MSKLTIESAQAAGDEWGFNCGPGALCGVLDLTPEEVRPHLGDFEQKGYTNPTLMAHALHSLGMKFRRKFECAVHVEGRPHPDEWPLRGFVRVQWDGPWTNPGVPMAARYRHTHWIGFKSENTDGSGGMVFDVNCMAVGGWVTLYEWSSQVVPWLLPQVQPRANGKWWPTHCWELIPSD